MQVEYSPKMCVFIHNVYILKKSKINTNEIIVKNIYIIFMLFKNPGRHELMNRLKDSLSLTVFHFLKQ